MHDVPTRQLIALCLAFVASFAPCSSAPDDSPAVAIGERIKAAKLMQAALAARSAPPEEWRKLEEEYIALATRFPNDVSVMNARAEFLWEIGERSRAIHEWERAERIEPKNARILERLGESMLVLGAPGKAAAYYERAVACDRGNATLHFALANVWFLFRHEMVGHAQGDEGTLLKGALMHFAEAARLAPQNAEYARAYAETFYGVPHPDWSAALGAWQEVHRLSPDKFFALGNLARVQLNMGHFDSAEECLSRMEHPSYKTLRDRLSLRIEAARGARPKPAECLDLHAQE